MMPYGQHFLTDERPVHKLLDLLNGAKVNSIVEIGPGRGFITKFLLSRGYKVFAYEIDERIADELIKTVNDEKLQVCVKDFLKVCREELPTLECCVGSIPYQISSKIVQKLIILGFRKAILIVQKEFADKLMAKPSLKKYTFISALAQSFFDIERICLISKNSFSPAPKVDSAMIVLNRKEQTPLEIEYITFLRRVFSSPNKKIEKVLKKLSLFKGKVPDKHVRDLSAAELIKVYKSCREWLNDQSRTF